MAAIARGKKQRAAGEKQKRKRLALDEEVTRLRSQVGRMAKQGGPVIAGPFTGEVGFELLYWIPLLRWAVREFPELEGRMIVVSRGGVQGWIGLDVRYIDILSLFPPEEFAAHRALSDKQRDIRDFDDKVVEEVERHLGIEGAQVLHPSMLYQAYFRFLKINQLAYLRSLERGENGVVDGLAAVYEPIRKPERPDVLSGLPDEYMAVRFYSRDSFPQSAASAGFASAVIDALARVTNVVLIGTQLQLDEHRDVQGELPSGVTTIDHLLKPEDNLAIQTAVVAHAKAFVGTYGGFAYLAPFLGVPAISFSTDRAKTQPWHHELAQGIFEGPEWGDLVSLRHTDLALVELVTRGFEAGGIPAGWDQDTALQLEGGVRT